jgi:cytochrome c oxidase assembly protein subunit 15
VLVHRLPRISPAGYRRITLAALVALCFIIVTGGAVRLTGSGLGCSDWPGCEQERFVAPLELNPMVEFVNRVITGVVSVSIVLAVLGSLRRTPRRRDLTWLSLGLVGGVVGQILLGALTVHYELAPPFVMGHFLLSLVLVTNAAVLHHRAGEPEDPATPVELVERPVRSLILALGPALAVAVVAGTVVTGAGPHGGDEDAPRFGFEIETVTRVHSLAVLAFLGLLLAVLHRLHRDHAPAVVAQRARDLLTVSIAQATVGWTQYFTDVPALLVGIHILGATLTWLALCRLVLACRARVAIVPTASVPAGALAGSPS